MEGRGVNRTQAIFSLMLALAGAGLLTDLYLRPLHTRPGFAGTLDFTLPTGVALIVASFVMLLCDSSAPSWHRRLAKTRAQRQKEVRR